MHNVLETKEVTQENIRRQLQAYTDAQEVT
jgi:hypothetical protein